MRRALNREGLGRGEALRGGWDDRKKAFPGKQLLAVSFSGNTYQNPSVHSVARPSPSLALRFVTTPSPTYPPTFLPSLVLLISSTSFYLNFFWCLQINPPPFSVLFRPTSFSLPLFWLFIYSFFYIIPILPASSSLPPYFLCAFFHPFWLTRLFSSFLLS